MCNVVVGSMVVLIALVRSTVVCSMLSICCVMRNAAADYEGSTGDVVALKAALGEVGSLVHSEVVRTASANGEVTAAAHDIPAMRVWQLAIHLAAAQGHVEVVELLISAKAQLEATQHAGRTALLVTV